MWDIIVDSAGFDTAHMCGLEMLNKVYMILLFYSIIIIYMLPINIMFVSSFSSGSPFPL